MLQWQLIPLSAMDSNPHMQKLIIIVAALYTGQICSVASSLLECWRKLARHAALSLYTQPFACRGFLQMCQCYSWKKCIFSGSLIWVSKMCIWRGLEPNGTMGCMHSLIVGLLCDWHRQARVSLQMCCQNLPFASVLIQEESNWASPEIYFMFLPRGITFECWALLISLDGAKRWELEWSMEPKFICIQLNHQCACSIMHYLSHM